MNFIEILTHKPEKEDFRIDSVAGFSDCTGCTVRLYSRENVYGEPYSACIGRGFDGSRDCIGLGFTEYDYSYDECEYLKGQGFGDGIDYYHYNYEES